jgi:hypothetical protein
MTFTQLFDRYANVAVIGALLAGLPLAAISIMTQSF